MPFAKYDVDLPAAFAAVPPRDRAAAIAFYWRAVQHSASMLADGHLSRVVLDSLFDEVGVAPGLKRGRPRDRIVRELTKLGLLTGGSRGPFRLAKWDEHHSSRVEVEDARKRAAERKRRSRGQLPFPDVTGMSQRDNLVTSQRDNDVTAVRVRARAQEAEAETEREGPKAEGPRGDTARAPNGLPFEKELELTRLLAWIGEHADPGTRQVIRDRAYKLPLAGLVRVRESAADKHPRNRAGYVVAALDSELEHHDLLGGDA